MFIKVHLISVKHFENNLQSPHKQINKTKQIFETKAK